MITYQLDECVNSKKFMRACKRELFRFPNRLRGTKDPDMLNELLPMGNPLLTTDGALIYEHFDAIPILHPGIVIISNAETVLKTLTIKQIQIILRTFKSKLLQWHELSCRNSIIQITQNSISISHTQDNRLIYDGICYYEVSDWNARVKELLGILHKNANRCLPE